MLARLSGFSSLLILPGQGAYPDRMSVEVDPTISMNANRGELSLKVIFR